MSVRHWLTLHAQCLDASQTLVIHESLYTQSFDSHDAYEQQVEEVAQDFGHTQDCVPGVCAYTKTAVEVVCEGEVDKNGLLLEPSVKISQNTQNNKIFLV